MEVKKIGELESLAKGGDVGAIYELGERYFKGIGVKVDYAKARGYFEIASERGSQASNYYLGKIYYNGNGVETNHLKAKEYFEKSAGSDNVFSTFYLGKLYFWGDGVEQSTEKADAYKKQILSKPLYSNQDASLKDFYTVTDFEDLTKKYVGDIQAKVLKEYKELYGKVID